MYLFNLIMELLLCRQCRHNCLGSSLSLMWNYLVKYRYLWGPGLQIVEHLHKAEFVPSRAVIGQLGPRDPIPRCDWSSRRLTSPPLGRIPGKWVRIKSVGGWWTLGPPAPSPGGRVMADMQEMFDNVRKPLSWASLASFCWRLPDLLNHCLFLFDNLG